MAGRKNTKTIDEKITQAQENVIRTKEKSDEAVAFLEELLKKKKAMQEDELLRLFANSNRSFDEVAAFLKEGMTEEQLINRTKKKPGRKPKNNV